MVPGRMSTALLGMWHPGVTAASPGGGMEFVGQPMWQLLLQDRKSLGSMPGLDSP